MLPAVHAGAARDSPSVVGPSANGCFRRLTRGRRGSRFRSSAPPRTDASGGSRGAARESLSVVGSSANGCSRRLTQGRRGSRHRSSGPRRTDTSAGSRGGGAGLAIGRRILGERTLPPVHGGAARDSPSVVGLSANGCFARSRRGGAGLPVCRRADWGTGAAGGSRRDGRGRAAAVGAVGEPAFRAAPGEHCRSRIFPPAPPRALLISPPNHAEEHGRPPRGSAGARPAMAIRTAIRTAAGCAPRVLPFLKPDGRRPDRRGVSRDTGEAESGRAPKGAPPLPGPEPRRPPPVGAAAPSSSPP